MVALKVRPGRAHNDLALILKTGFNDQRGACEHYLRAKVAAARAQQLSVQVLAL